MHYSKVAIACVMLGTAISISACSHKEKVDADFVNRITYLNSATDTFKEYKIRKNSDINNKINEYIQDKVDEEFPLTINVGELTYDLQAILDGVLVKYDGYNLNWDGKTRNLFNFFDKEYVEPEIIVSKHYEYEDALVDIQNRLSEKLVKATRPKFEFNGSGLSALDNGSTGIDIDIDGIKNTFIEKVNAHENGANIAVEEVVTYSDISVDDINEIDTKLSTFSTWFANTASRGGNIHVAAERINGTILAPGETLSVDKKILSRNAANGYYKAGSYLNGKTVQTYGGGVCQVSTTLYGAILRAGIVPTERYAHSMAVTYVPLGLDAAISEGYKDLKITNTYDKPIYIRASSGGGQLTFSIYGNSSLDEYDYKPRSTSSKNGLSADSWLQKLDKSGNIVEEIHLFKSNYIPHT